MGHAARRLSTSQPDVSRSISDLEHALGVRLLDRSRQGVEPTSYGRALVARGLAIFDELAQGIGEIRFLADPFSGQLATASACSPYREEKWRIDDAREDAGRRQPVAWPVNAMLDLRLRCLIDLPRPCGLGRRFTDLDWPHVNPH